MKRYTTSRARERLADVLDAVDAGEQVVIERRGVRYSISAERTVGRKQRRPIIEAVDEPVASGQWTWDWQPAGLSFAPRKRR